MGKNIKNMRVGVLMGGLSAEREVSLKSGAGVLKTLSDAGYDAVGIDVGRDLAARLVAERVEAAFICLHGRYGEDGSVQGLLELMGIPYTGSGVLASALAMDKIFAKKIFAASGLTITPYIVVRQGETISVGTLPFPLPVVVKPSREGSSVGVSIVKSAEGLQQAVDEAFSYDREILVEQYVKGREIQVGILDGKGIGAIEIVPKNEFYDFEAKYTDGMATHILPAPMPPEQYAALLQAGEKAHTCLGCSGYSRVDFIVTPDCQQYILEVNTLPGMTALSLLPEIAQGAGISFTELVERIIFSAALKI